MAHLREVGGKGYRGAGLGGLEYEIEKVEGDIRFVFKDLETIVD